MLPSPAIMLITDKTQAKLPLPQIVRGALEGGCRWVLLRDPDLGEDELYTQGAELKKICDGFQAKLFISQHAGVAKKLGAAGLHLRHTQSVTAARKVVGLMTIGQSCHNGDEIARAVDEGADYITYSPIFVSESKPDYGPALGLEKLQRVAVKALVPVIALGGITPLHALECMKAGATGFAVMGGIMRAENPASAMRLYMNAQDA